MPEEQNTETPVELNTEASPELDRPTDDAPRPADDPQTDEAQSPNAEAAAYRRRLREVEQQRDELLARVETFQRAEVARLAGESLSAPDDLLTFSGLSLGDFLTEGGEVDPDRVSEAVRELVATRPGLARPELQPRRPFAPDPNMGKVGDRIGWGGPTLADAFRC